MGHSPSLLVVQLGDLDRPMDALTLTTRHLIIACTTTHHQTTVPLMVSLDRLHLPNPITSFLLAGRPQNPPRTPPAPMTRCQGTKMDTGLLWFACHSPRPFGSADLNRYLPIGAGFTIRYGTKGLPNTLLKGCTDKL